MADSSNYLAETLDYDPFTGITETFVWDGAAGTMAIHYRQDIEPMLREAQDARKDESGWGANKWKADGHRVASIPAIVEMELRRQGKWLTQDENAFARWLVSTDAAPYRTKTGRV